MLTGIEVEAFNKPFIANRIIVIGCGLIGGSVALAAKGVYRNIDIIGVDLQAKMQDLLRQNATLKAFKEIHTLEGFLDENRLQSGDFVVISAPLGSYCNILERMNVTERNVAICDAGSAKGFVFKLGQWSNHSSHFIPCHPIAGREVAGLLNAQEGLFESKITYICPSSQNSLAKVVAVDNFWKSIGSKTKLISADLHDTIYASVSHAVQMIIFSYHQVLNQDIDSYILNSIHAKYYNAYQQFLRLAKSDKVMWQDIFAHNKAAIKKEIENFLIEVEKGLRFYTLPEDILQDESSKPLAVAMFISNFILCTFGHNSTFAGTGFKSATALSRQVDLICAKNELAKEGRTKEGLAKEGGKFKYKAEVEAILVLLQLTLLQT